MMKTGRTALAFFLVFLTTGSFAGDNGAPLKDADIATFISIWPQAATALSEADPEFDPTLTNALRSQLEEMAASDSNDSKLDAAAVASGYIDFEVFAATAGRILLAAQWATDAPDAGDLNAAIDAIEKDEVRTADEKAELIGALKKAYGKALADKPSDSDIALTKPFASAISKAIGVDE
jgi:hypothetical protein